MSTNKLRLGPLPRVTTVKLLVTMPTDLKAMLDRYATQHSKAYGEPVDAASLVPHILKAFMENDRAFKAIRTGETRYPEPRQ